MPYQLNSSTESFGKNFFVDADDTRCAVSMTDARGCGVTGEVSYTDPEELRHIADAIQACFQSPMGHQWSTKHRLEEANIEVNGYGGQVWIIGHGDRDQAEFCLADAETVTAVKRDLRAACDMLRDSWLASRARPRP